MEGKKAPYFSLSDQYGDIHTLDEYKGKWLLIYFYPKDDTPGCMKEACAFRDIASEYSKHNISVVGISKDTVASHNRFAQKYHLSFSLLSDESKEVIKAYGAWGEKKFMGKVFEGIKRISFLVGPDQTIQKEYLMVDVFSHAQKILTDFKTLSQKV